MIRRVDLNRFIKTLGLLIISLFALSAGVNATLDRLDHSPRHSQLSLYSADGRVLAVYTGDIRELARAERAAQEYPLPARRSL
jgi:hypothetical protein